jgi:hypothetical protein
MEQDMSAEGITDELRVRHIENWFSGDALKLVQSTKNNDILMDATTTLRSIKETFDFIFKEKKEFDVKKVLKNVAKGNPITKGNIGSTESFIVELQCQFHLARGKGEEAIFEKESTYVDIMNAKLPYLIEKWTRKFKTGKRGKFQGVHNICSRGSHDGGRNSNQCKNREQDTGSNLAERK